MKEGKGHDSIDEEHNESQDGHPEERPPCVCVCMYIIMRVCVCVCVELNVHYTTYHSW